MRWLHIRFVHLLMNCVPSLKNSFGTSASSCNVSDIVGSVVYLLIVKELQRYRIARRSRRQWRETVMRGLLSVYEGGAVDEVEQCMWAFGGPAKESGKSESFKHQRVPDFSAGVRGGKSKFGAEAASRQLLHPLPWHNCTFLRDHLSQVLGCLDIMSSS